GECLVRASRAREATGRWRLVSAGVPGSRGDSHGAPSCMAATGSCNSAGIASRTTDRRPTSPGTTSCTGSPSGSDREERGPLLSFVPLARPGLTERVLDLVEVLSPVLGPEQVERRPRRRVRGDELD